MLASVAMAANAMAISPPGPVTSNPGSPSADGTITFSWSVPADAAPGNTVSFRGGVSGADGDLGQGTSAARALGEGSHTFSVRAIESDPSGAVVGESSSASRTVVVDLTAPTIRGVISPATPNGRDGWYTRATITWTCADPGGSGVASCPPTEVLDTARADRDQNSPDSIQSARLTIQRSAVDRVGRSATATVGPIKFDALAPTAGQPKQPGADARIAREPTYVWGRAGNDTSGVERYEVWVEEAGRAPRIVATVPHVAGVSEFSATRTSPTPLTPLARVTWYVRSIDVAGNARDSSRRSFTIDPTVPPAPAITEGPAGPTRVSAPAFAWIGAPGASFRWDLTALGTDDTRVVREGSGAGTRVVVAPLPDGVYVFRVTQVSGVGVVSEEAARNFEIDTVAPAPPVITGRPSRDAPFFSWSTEAGATSRWIVTDAAGGPLGPASDTPTTTAPVGGLSAGDYGFSVQQIDAAGNVSAAAADRFVVASPATTTATPAARAAALPRRNAKRLRPRAGVVVRTRRPILRWARGPAGTRLYNLQLFRAMRGSGGRVTAVRKVLSAFPGKRRYRVAAARLRPGACYVWRVWPYRGRSFTRVPLGVSNFCVASPEVLKKAAARRARAAAARRSANR